MKRRKLVIGLVIAVAFIALVLVVALRGGDIAPPDVSDLSVYRPVVGPETNAFTYFFRASELVDWPTNGVLVSGYLGGKPVSAVDIEALLNSNTEAIAQVERGTKCIVLQAPEITGFDALIPYVSEWLRIAKILAVRSRFARLSGQYSAATESCITLVSFARLIQANPECLISYLVGLAAADMGLAQARDLACDAGTPLAECEKLQEAASGFGSLYSGFVMAMKTEYRFASVALAQIQDGQLSIGDLATIGGAGGANPLLKQRVPRYLLHPNRTRLRLAGFYRQMIASAPLPYSDCPRMETDLGPETGGSMAKLMLEANGVGRMLCALLLPALESMHERKCRTECSLSATRLLLAINLYERAEKRPPAALGDLVPGYLELVPRDPYDGKLFRYLPDKGLIYSVGKDLVDSGGSTNQPTGTVSTSFRKSIWKREDIVLNTKRSHSVRSAGAGGETVDE